MAHFPGVHSALGNLVSEISLFKRAAKPFGTHAQTFRVADEILFFLLSDHSLPTFRVRRPQSAATTLVCSWATVIPTEPLVRHAVSGRRFQKRRYAGFDFRTKGIGEYIDAGHDVCSFLQ